MTVTFFSSVLNHHQLLFCREMYNAAGVDFHFVQTIELTEERKAQGFKIYDEPYVVNAITDSERAYKLSQESDIVIAGVINQAWVNERLSKGKITFVYKERFLKNATAIFRPGFWINGYKNYFRFRNKELYFLCASAHNAKDSKIFFPRPKKKFKWGYFPEVSNHKDIDALIAGKADNTILWTGRFLDCKHPDNAVVLAERLLSDEYDFSLKIIGIGPMKETLVNMVKEKGLSERVEILDSMPPEKIRENMSKSEIFLFTSDRAEGWGAVLNEAMSEGCACVATHQAGSTDFLIEDGKNGFSFDFNDIDLLTRRVKELLDNKDKLNAIQKEAVKTINNEWNASVAAGRLCKVFKAVIERKDIPQYASGPMSRAE